MIASAIEPGINFLIRHGERVGLIGANGENVVLNGAPTQPGALAKVRPAAQQTARAVERRVPGRRRGSLAGRRRASNEQARFHAAAPGFSRVRHLGEGGRIGRESHDAAVLAAHRIEADTVLIPDENVKDLAEIPDNVKNRLDIHPVKWIDQVLDLALERKPEALPDQPEPPIPSAAESSAPAAIKH